MKQKNLSDQFVVCVQNEAECDLIPRKIYQVRRDDAAAADGLLRIIDDSGEDYLYPATYFEALELPAKIQRALTTPSEPALQR